MNKTYRITFYWKTNDPVTFIACAKTRALAIYNAAERYGDVDFDRVEAHRMKDGDVYP